MASKGTAQGWVILGGKVGDLGYCKRCDGSLQMNLPQPLYLVVAAMKAFAKMHGKCAPKPVEGESHD